MSSRAPRGICTFLLLLSAPLAAQEPQQHTHTGRRALLTEVGAGTAGSFFGMLPVMLIPSCLEHTHYNERVDCREPLVLGVYLFSPIATAVGVSLTAGHNGTPRSRTGAWLGAVAGGLAGAALANVLDQNGMGPILSFPTFYVTQATLSTLGSRVVGSMRNR